MDWKYLILVSNCGLSELELYGRAYQRDVPPLHSHRIQFSTSIHRYKTTQSAIQRLLVIRKRAPCTYQPWRAGCEFCTRPPARSSGSVRCSSPRPRHASATKRIVIWRHGNPRFCLSRYLTINLSKWKVTNEIRRSGSILPSFMAVWLRKRHSKLCVDNGGVCQ